MTSYNHVIINGAPRISATEGFSQLWALTRAMKKAGWRHRASSDGTTKTVSDDPADDRWASTFGVIGPVTNVGAAGATIAAAVNGRTLVSGLTGIVSTAYAHDKGRFLIDVAAGTAHQILKVVDATSCYVDATDSPVTPGAGKTWEIRDPSLDTYVGHLNGVRGWICFTGPMTVKVPCAAGAAEGILINENVTQEATGATAKLLSVAPDGTYMVLFPRVKGTGAGYGGFDLSVIAGDVSGIEVTPSAALRAMQLEMVIAKGATTDNYGGIWGMAVQLPGDTDALSTLASAAGCTELVAPGSGGTGNVYPAHAFAIAGTPSDTTNYGANLIFGGTDIQPAMIGCVDAIPDEEIVADGSFFIAYRPKSTNATTDAPQVVSLQYCLPNPGEMCNYMVFGNGGSNGLLLRTSAGQNNQNGQEGPVSSSAWFEFDTPREFYSSRANEASMTTGFLGGLTNPMWITEDTMRLVPIEFGPTGDQGFDSEFTGFNTGLKVPLWSYRSSGYFHWETLHVNEDVKVININATWYIGPWDGSLVTS